MQIIRTDTGFILHKVTMQISKCVFFAWYDKQGNLLDCERFNITGHSLPCNNNQKEWLESKGRIFV